jgi:hypothetical protein
VGRRRNPEKYPYDYTEGDDRGFADSGTGGTLRVVHGPGRGMGVTDGVACRVEVIAADGALLDEAGKLGKENRLHGTATDGTGVCACALGGHDGRELLMCCAPDFYEHTRAPVREAVLLSTQVDVPHAGLP